MKLKIVGKIIICKLADDSLCTGMVKMMLVMMLVDVDLLDFCLN